MNKHFEILPFPAALLESAIAFADEGVQDERFTRGMGRSGRPMPLRGRPGGRTAQRAAFGAGSGVAAPVRAPARPGQVGRAGKVGKVVRGGGVKSGGMKAMPGGFAGSTGAGRHHWPHNWPHDRPHNWPRHGWPHHWPHGWFGGYGIWPPGAVVFEPDWLALADVPPGDGPQPGQDSSDGQGDSDVFDDGGADGFFPAG